FWTVSVAVLFGVAGYNMLEQIASFVGETATFLNSFTPQGEGTITSTTTLAEACEGGGIKLGRVAGAFPCGTTSSDGNSTSSGGSGCSDPLCLGNAVNSVAEGIKEVANTLIAPALTSLQELNEKVGVSECLLDLNACGNALAANDLCDKNLLSCTVYLFACIGKENYLQDCGYPRTSEVLCGKIGQVRKNTCWTLKGGSEECKDVVVMGYENPYGDPPSDKECFGRCGVKCRPSDPPGGYIYTQNCLAHDWCQHFQNDQDIPNGPCSNALSDAAMDQLRAAYETCDYSSGKLKSLNLPVSYPPSGPYFKNRVLMENGNTFEFSFNVSSTQISSSKADSSEWVTSSTTASKFQVHIDNLAVFINYIEVNGKEVPITSNNLDACFRISSGGIECQINQDTWKMTVLSKGNKAEIYNVTFELH
ncbi:hypothetical protein WDW89_12885, partial [Deltaproteobacteria bacterium TL4]